MRLYISYFLLISSLPAFSQTFSGTVKDASSKSPLPYVHIGVLNRNMGVISREDGSFLIDLSNAQPEDQLLFSMIGYETQKIVISKLKETNLTILLVPKTYQLKEVTVKGKRKFKKDFTKLGRSKPTTTTTGRSREGEFGYGGEWGLSVSTNGKKYKIIDAQFHLRFNTVDSALFRIQVYSIKDGMPNESLLKKETFVKSKSGDHWIVCYLDDQDITIDQEVIITYETVRVWFRKNGVNELFYTFGAGHEFPTYSRNSSHDAWKINGDVPRVAMFLTVEEVKPETPKK